MIRSRARRLTVFAAATAFAAAPVSLSVTGTASAFCNGASSPYAQWVGSPYNVDERPQSGTCNNDDEYRGQYRDPTTDGQDVYIRYNQNGIWRTTASNGSTSWAGYAYIDSNSYSPSQLCGTVQGCYSTQYYNGGF